MYYWRCGLFLSVELNFSALLSKQMAVCISADFPVVLCALLDVGDVYDKAEEN